MRALVPLLHGGAGGLDTRAAMGGGEAGLAEAVCEPYLGREGFLVGTPKGRVATAKAWEHLGLTPRDDVSQLT